MDDEEMERAAYETARVLVKTLAHAGYEPRMLVAIVCHTLALVFEHSTHGGDEQAEEVISLVREAVRQGRARHVRHVPADDEQWN